MSMLTNELRKIVRDNEKFGDLELCLKWHRRLWDFLSTVENPQCFCGDDLKFATFFNSEKVRQDLLKEFELNEEEFEVFRRPGCGCFCCLYAEHKYLQNTCSFYKVGTSRCKNCPLSWGKDKEEPYCCSDDDEEYGLYESWSYMIENQEYDKAGELALTIRDLPLCE